MRMTESASPAPDFGVGSTWHSFVPELKIAALSPLIIKTIICRSRKVNQARYTSPWVDGLPVQENICLDCSLSSVGGGGVPVRGGGARSLIEMGEMQTERGRDLLTPPSSPC